MNEQTIRDDKFIRELLGKLPGPSRSSFSDEQLIALKAGLGGRAWGHHAVDLRWTLRFWRWHYYFVVLAGRNRRELSRREAAIARMALAITISVFLIVSTVLGLLILYLLKSALGIDLFPGFSLGIWGWFKDAYLN
ncbi:MAG: hypothetical protein WAV95_19635 [Azonexus sp.]